MNNESSLNDVFRFVQLRGGNILKSYPLKRTAAIQSAQTKTTKEKKEIADAFFSNFDFTINKLILGKEIRSSLLSFANDSKTNVGHFYTSVFDDLASNYNVEEGFSEDLSSLSELVYFSHYSNYEDLSEDHLQLYVMYQVLERARTYIPFRTFSLHKIKLLGLGKQKEAFIKSVGVADLLVVKQHLLRYEETEIAHIENVMKGETRSREHRFLDRFEETLIYEKEKSVESEKESESKERFEMNRETSNTIQEDQKFSSDLSVSGTYGPTTVAANLAYSMDSSETTENKSSSEYAKDIMDRSLEKVNERVRTERITKIIKENETKDLHSFTNVAVEGSGHAELEQISGIYQFVDKIYKAQVFNYGQREMFDLMIPEPASYLRFLNNSETSSVNNDLQAPLALTINPFDIDGGQRSYSIAGRPSVLNTNHYTHLGSIYGATALKQSPQERTVSFSVVLPKTDMSTEPSRAVVSEGSELPEGWIFYPPSILNIDIPSGYVPSVVHLNILAFSDTGRESIADTLIFHLNFGGAIEKEYSFGDSDSDFREIRSGDGRNYAYSCSDTITIEYTEEFQRLRLNDTAGYKVSYTSQDSANHTIKMEITCVPSEELIKEWQLETYDLLQTAYQDRLMEYESKLAQLKADRRAQDNLEKNNFGVPPSKQKQVILTELKKHAVSIFTDNLEHSPNDTSTDTTEYPMNYPVDNSTPPKIDRIKAKRQGDFIRFFEQSFEWAQMQYAFYPYFWSKENWDDKFKLDDPNYEYQQFLQAGAARLVLPVRPGFEKVVAHYIETGNVWGGIGTPVVEDPLYLSIVDEIKERSGKTNNDPIPVGEPWEVRLPTSLIKLKAEDTLPKWKIKDGEVWDWEKDETQS